MTTAAELVTSLECVHHCVPDQVLGLSAVTGQPARVAIQPIDLGPEGDAEAVVALIRRRLGRARRLPPVVQCAFAP